MPLIANLDMKGLGDRSCWSCGGLGLNGGAAGEEDVGGTGLGGGGAEDVGGTGLGKADAEGVGPGAWPGQTQGNIHLAKQIASSFS